MKTFSTERGNHLFMSCYNITPAKEEEKKIICASHALYKKRPELELVEGGGGVADHIHMSAAPKHPAFNMARVYFCLIEAFSCLQLTQKQQGFIYGQL